eukprot:TRINITY_DN3693_c0_g1_i1.p1 TRINITY_DN3693_c0_g1~~TRINITY_DN3693_c0_g1_i1.p1  ORF type:complete len:144 (-),score=17.09 TRINITY_DN3693_c0_g1_i1:81-512(-)
MTHRTLTFVLAAVLLSCQVTAHNWLMAPPSRANQAQTETGCRFGGEGNPTCAGPCDKPAGQSSVSVKAVQRGQQITVSWNRHNHPGGFIRLAWAQTSASNSHASFDQGIDRFLCKEVGGCGPSDPSDDGSTNGKACTTTIQVP